MFFRLKNILPKNQINKKFFSNQCKIGSYQLDNINKLLKHIYIINCVNFSINFLIFLIK